MGQRRSSPWTTRGSAAWSKVGAGRAWSPRLRYVGLRDGDVLQRVAEPCRCAPRGSRGEYDLAQRRAVLAVFLERVDVGPARPGNRFQPDRLRLRVEVTPALPVARP